MPAEAVHLEETILPVDESQPEGQILAVAGADGRHPLSVAFDADLGMKASENDLPFDLRKAATDGDPRPEGNGPDCDDREYQQHDRGHQDLLSFRGHPAAPLSHVRPPGRG